MAAVHPAGPDPTMTTFSGMPRPPKTRPHSFDHADHHRLTSLAMRIAPYRPGREPSKRELADELFYGGGQAGQRGRAGRESGISKTGGIDRMAERLLRLAALNANSKVDLPPGEDGTRFGLPKRMD